MDRELAISLEWISPTYQVHEVSDTIEAMQHRYHINVFWYPDDTCWIADVPDLKPCSAHGDTPAEALAEAELAIELWIETARERGLPVPEPRYRPATYATA